MNERGRIRYAGDTGDAVLPRDDRAVDEHAASPLDNGRCQRDDKSDRGIDGIADKDFPCLEAMKVRCIGNDPRLSPGKTRPCRLSRDLARLRPEPLFLHCLPGTLRRHGIRGADAFDGFQELGFRDGVVRCEEPLIPVYRQGRLALDPAEIDVVIVPGAVAGAGEVQELLCMDALLSFEPFQERSLERGDVFSA